MIDYNSISIEKYSSPAAREQALMKLQRSIYEGLGGNNPTGQTVMNFAWSREPTPYTLDWYYHRQAAGINASAGSPRAKALERSAIASFAEAEARRRIDYGHVEDPAFGRQLATFDIRREVHQTERAMGYTGSISPSPGSMDAWRAHQEQFDRALVLDGWSPLARGAANFLTPSQSNPHGGNLDNFVAVFSPKGARSMQARTGVRRSELTSGVRDRGAALGQRQGREFRTDTLQALEFDQNAPRHVRGWLTNERRRLEFGASHVATPPGYEMSHGRGTPAREGFDCSNSRLQGTDLNRLEERIRRQKGRH